MARRPRPRLDPVDLAFVARGEITECEVDGRCQEVSEAVVSKLIDAGYNAWVAYGTYKQQPHAWVIFGKRYLDPTFDQFGEDETTYIRTGRVTDPDYQRDYRI